MKRFKRFLYSGLLSHSDLAAELATNWRLFRGNLDQVLADLRYPMTGAPFHFCKFKEIKAKPSLDRWMQACGQGCRNWLSSRRWRRLFLCSILGHRLLHGLHSRWPLDHVFCHCARRQTEQTPDRKSKAGLWASNSHWHDNQHCDASLCHRLNMAEQSEHVNMALFPHHEFPDRSENLLLPLNRHTSLNTFLTCVSIINRQTNLNMPNPFVTITNRQALLHQSKPWKQDCNTKSQVALPCSNWFPRTPKRRKRLHQCSTSTWTACELFIRQCHYQAVTHGCCRQADHQKIKQINKRQADHQTNARRSH